MRSHVCKSCVSPAHTHPCTHTDEHAQTSAACLRHPGPRAASVSLALSPTAGQSRGLGGEEQRGLAGREARGGTGRAAVPSAACTLLGLASHVADEDPVVPTLYIFSVVKRLGFQNAQTMTSVTYSRT